MQKRKKNRQQIQISRILTQNRERFRLADDESESERRRECSNALASLIWFSLGMIVCGRVHNITSHQIIV